MKFEISRELYSKGALMKAAYTYIDDYYIHLDLNQQYYEVTIEPKQNKDIYIQENDFENEILIQQIRNDVWEKTSSLRKMIYARALASTIIDIYDNQSELTEEKESDSESILKDWYVQQN